MFKFEKFRPAKSTISSPFQNLQIYLYLYHRFYLLYDSVGVMLLEKDLIYIYILSCFYLITDFIHTWYLDFFNFSFLQAIPKSNFWVKIKKDKILYLFLQLQPFSCPPFFMVKLLEMGFYNGSLYFFISHSFLLAYCSNDGIL